MRQERCDNCDRPLLATDTVCWHCGQPRQASAPAPAAPTESSQLTAVSGYALLTLAILIALLLVMRSLAQQPLIVVNTNAPRPRGWVVFTDKQHRFTVNLPPEWQVAQPDEAPFTALQEKYDVWKTAVSPLDPSTILLLASNPDANDIQLVAIARNVQLHQLPTPRLTSLINEQGLQIQQIEESESFFGSPQINLTFPTNNQDDEMICTQQYALQPENSYLLTICMTENSLRRSRDTIEAIQGSFQPLNP